MTTAVSHDELLVLADAFEERGDDRAGKLREMPEPSAWRMVELLPRMEQHAFLLKWTWWIYNHYIYRNTIKPDVFHLALEAKGRWIDGEAEWHTVCARERDVYNWLTRFEHSAGANTEIGWMVWRAAILEDGRIATLIEFCRHCIFTVNSTRNPAYDDLDAQEVDILTRLWKEIR